MQSSIDVQDFQQYTSVMKTFDLKTKEGLEDDAMRDAMRDDDVTDDPDVHHHPVKVTLRHVVLGPVIFLYFSGMMMSLFIIVQYSYRRVQMDEYPDKTFDTGASFCTRNMSAIYRQNKVQQTVSLYTLAFSLVGGIPAVFVNVLLGAYTDRYGRKFVMVLAITGTFLRVVVSLIGVYIKMDLKLFAIGFFLEGLCGQPFNFLLAVYSYASDVTTRRNRAIGIVLCEMCVGLGSSLPTFAVGYFVQEKGFKGPFILCLACLAVSILLALFVLTESFPKERRAKTSETCINLKHALGFYFSSSNAGKRWKYNVTIIAFFITMTDLLGRNNVETLYQMNAPFCWSPTKLGWYGALRTGLQQVLGMVMVGILKKFLAEESIALIGCVSFAAGFIIEAFAKTDVHIYLVTVVGACGVLTIPMARTILSRMTSPQKQGALAASISAVETTSSMVAIVTMTAIYKSTVNDFGGAVFIVMAVLNAVAFLLIMILKLGSRDDTDEKEKNNIQQLSLHKLSSADL